MGGIVSRSHQKSNFKYGIIRLDCIEHFQNFDFADNDCLSITLSKILGYLMILGSTLVKFPQIIKIMKGRSAKGLVAKSYYTECLMNSITFCYNTHIGTPFNVYGDSLFLLLQSAITIALIWEYRADISLKEKIFTGVFIFSFITYLYTDAFVPETIWT